jgi:hypothetical protein
MKNLVVCGLALAACAGGASAMTISAQPITGNTGFVPRNVSVFSTLTGGYASFAAATGIVGFDDYQTTNLADGTTLLAQFKFVGGVTTVGGHVDFQFYDPTGSTVLNTVGVNFPQVGNFIWTITLGALPDGSDSTFLIPTNGVFAAQVDAATTGQFFLTAAGNPAPLAGTTSPTYGAGSGLGRNQAFELIAVPAPGAAALLGLGGLLTVRRRR